MTPGARVAAAIAVLDQIKDGSAAEQALTAWARGSRYAGSKDRAAVRDHVFDVLRARRSLGDGNGRRLMQRLAKREGWQIDDLFNGEGHAPSPLSDDERVDLSADLDLNEAAACDLPDWLWPLWQDSLGPDAQAAALVQQGRADVFLRVNQRRGTTADAAAQLAQAGIATRPHPTVATCLRVMQNPRSVKTSNAYQYGLVELQDAASQFAINAVSAPDGARILDYCAGGGGKALGFADLRNAQVFAYDIDPGRMRDLPERAARAAVQITTLTSAELSQSAPYDLVFCDAPCSGAGAWRRTPDAKWRLTAERLEALMQSQDAVLDAAAPLVADGGHLVYATCSVLKDENSRTIARFLAKNSSWRIDSQFELLPNSDGDGFYLCVLDKN
ncbi:MAG: 16S rRNA (cytosine967-C5)-methyltransferase [Yoonia sp.]|jgi:16S rRNA (cytosine967-C5)-methyltransferase